jgi:hypothetical protein
LGTEFAYFNYRISNWTQMHKNYLRIAKFFLLLLLVFETANDTLAGSSDGRISQVGPSLYTISFPNQNIRVNFGVTPSHGLQHFVSVVELDDHVMLELVNLLKEQIDQLPAAFVGRYLPIEILPMHIHNSAEFGFTLDQRMILEVVKSKPGMSIEGSIKFSFLHQTAFLLSEEPSLKARVKDFHNYLNSLHDTFLDSPNQPTDTDFHKGYVSEYASGEIGGSYSPAAEFAELFAHLLCNETRSEVLDFAHENQESLLGIKVRRFINFLDTNVPGFEPGFFTTPTISAYQTPDVEDGALLLSVHELRSYESIDFSAMEDPRSGYSNSGDLYEDLPVRSWEDGTQRDEPLHQPVLEDYKPYDQAEHKNDQANKKRKNKKRKDGSGWLLAGAAIYVLMQLAK